MGEEQCARQDRLSATLENGSLEYQRKLALSS